MVGNTRLARNASNGNGRKSETSPSKSRRASNARIKGVKKGEARVDSEVDISDEESDAYVNDDEDEDEDDDAFSLNSDNLDDPDFDTSSARKRKRAAVSARSSPKKTARSSTKSPTKKKKKSPTSDDEEEELVDGQEVVGTVVEAPKTGCVPPGQISQNTFNFLKLLQNPEYNDRTWFKLHEPVYRLAEKEWKAFIDEFTLLLVEADPQIPVLPPNDVVYRIYRDIRFSNDKTPYKTNFSASFSRSGRKGIFAGYHLSIKSGGSFFAAGTWCPGKNEVQTIRNNILRSSSRLRQVISNPAFVDLFGEPKPHPKGQRRNIFGMEDELKVAPKGVDKAHRDIDLLKCRSFAVSHAFTDKQVLDPNFKEIAKRSVEIARPFVHCLNDMMTIPPDDVDDGSEAEADDE